MTEPDRDPVLVVTELTKIYGGKKPLTAVDRLSFALGRGEILGLLGPNGAGKTTTIQMLMSTLTPTSGPIAYFGRSLETDREAILERVGFASAYSKLPLAPDGSTRTSTSSAGSTAYPPPSGRPAPASCSSGSASGT